MKITSMGFDSEKLYIRKNLCIRIYHRWWLNRWIENVFLLEYFQN